MAVTAIAFTLASALYTGFQWTIRVLVYPQFSRVGRPDFPDFERSHQRLVSYAVGPLFLALGLSALALVALPPAGVARWEAFAAIVPVGVILSVTALLAVPLHGRLSAGFDEAAHRRLLAVDSVRLVAAVAATVASVCVLVA